MRARTTFLACMHDHDLSNRSCMFEHYSFVVCSVISDKNGRGRNRGNIEQDAFGKVNRGKEILKRKGLLIPPNI